MNHEETVDNWLRQQSICVTGGRGLLGKRLVQRIVAGGGHRVVAFDRQSAILRDDTRQSQSVEHVVGSILDLSNLDRTLLGCTVVFHLAALVHVGRSESDPLRCFEVNALGTAHVLEACQRLGIQRVIYASTSHVYGIPRQLPIDEEHPTAPLSVYAASKLAGEVALQGYAANYALSCDIVRLANVYGASFSPETVIGRALGQVVTGGSISLRNLATVRDFVHVDDVVEALVRLAATGDKGTGCRVVNVSTGQGVSVLEIAETLSNIAAEQGLGRPEVIQTGSGWDELVPRLILDNRRLSKLIGWTPQISLEHGLRLALQEFRCQPQQAEYQQ